MIHRKTLFLPYKDNVCSTAFVIPSFCCLPTTIRQTPGHRYARFLITTHNLVSWCHPLIFESWCTHASRCEGYWRHPAFTFITLIIHRIITIISSPLCLQSLLRLISIFAVNVSVTFSIRDRDRPMVFAAGTVCICKSIPSQRTWQQSLNKLLIIKFLDNCSGVAVKHAHHWSFLSLRLLRPSFHSCYDSN